MSDLIMSSSSVVALPPLPLPAVDITIRPAVLGDVPFMDSLQKLHTKQVGWMPTAQFEGKIKLGHVLIAEDFGGRVSPPADWLETREAAAEDSRPPLPVGYVIGNDQYFKRDDVGIIYQMNIVPNRQRGFIGASLLKAMFDRSAYGCKLYCCWCAQDIAANKFWESMGFVPLAFRSGSAKRGKNGLARTHIFWQKRIRSGDTTTPYWFPSQTSSGSIREDRIVLPIPPGTHWNDAKPVLLPQTDGVRGSGSRVPGGKTKRLPGPTRNPDPGTRNPTPAITLGGLRFAAPKPAKPQKAPKPPKPKVKNDPKHVAAARELRDRWLERVNSEAPALSSGKYDVSRVVSNMRTTTTVEVVHAMPVLPAPIAA